MGLFAGALQAAPINVPGFSFETPSANTAFTVSTKIDNWTTFGDAPFDTGGGPASSGTGTFLNTKPDTTTYFSNATGAQVAYIFSKSSIGQQVGIEQILPTTFAANKAYTLSVDIGLAGSTPGASDPLTFALFYYDPGNPSARNVVGTRTIYNDGSEPLSATVLTTLSLTTPLLAPGDIAVGKQIGIELLTALPTDTAATAGRQYDFDNVQLTEVPEPGSLALIGGLAALALGRRRRQAETSR